MSSAAHLLESFPSHLRKAGLLRLASAQSELTTSEVLSPRSHESALQQLIFEGQIPPGGVTELCTEEGSALLTTIALRACRRVQQQSQELYGESSWCAFVDSSRCLYAPGVQAAKIDLSRLLVLRPDEEALYRVTLRLVESELFPLVVIDSTSFLGQRDHSLTPWVRVLRRLSSFLSQKSQSVLLLTQKGASRPLPLPVLQRIELNRSSKSELSVKVPKSSVGIYSGPLRFSLSDHGRRQAS
jgi:hypothetical protein